MSRLLPGPEGPPLPSKPVSVLPAKLGLSLTVPTREFRTPRTPHHRGPSSPAYRPLLQQVDLASLHPWDLHTGGSLQQPGERVAGR